MNEKDRLVVKLARVTGTTVEGVEAFFGQFEEATKSFKWPLTRIETEILTRRNRAD